VYVTALLTPSREGRLDLPAQRFDRQRRIRGWNQRALEEGRVAVVGDDDLLASLYVLSASALGLGELVVVAPRLDPRLRAIAANLVPGPEVRFLEGYCSHPAVGDVFAGCDVIVDLSRYGLANKLVLEKGFREGVPVIRGFCYERDGERGLKVFTCVRGREWEELRDLVSEPSLPRARFDDGVLDIIAAGIALEETKNLLMGLRTSEEAITYARPEPEATGKGSRVCVVGAGALGNFAGLALLYAGFREITFLDPDAVDVTNLNRQVFLSGAIGSNKAEALARALNGMFGTEVRGLRIRFEGGADLSEYDAVLDCTDNFETKIALSDECRDRRKILVSGGTGAEAGQALAYDPRRRTETPAEVMGLREIVAGRGVGADGGEEASCIRAPDPSVVMTNQIIAGLMVDSLRIVLGGGEAPVIFYDAVRGRRL
jgi:hypothetical protein